MSPLKKFSRLLVLLLICCFCLSCQKPLNIEQERKILLETDRKFSRTSVETGAAEAFRQFLDTLALSLPHDQEPIRGRDQIYQLMRDGDMNYILSWEPEDGDVAESGEMGYTWGIYKVTIINSDSLKNVRYGKYLNVWKKQSTGEWKVLIDMGNHNPG